jgi:hypothetical protein
MCISAKGPYVLKHDHYGDNDVTKKYGAKNIFSHTTTCI